MQRIKAIVVHPEQQHSFKTAEAFKNAKVLDKYITTVYTKPGSITNKITFFLSNDSLKRAKSRKAKGLKDNEVLQYGEFYKLLTLLFYRINKSGKISRFINKCLLKKFNKKVYKYIKKNGINVVVSYDLHSLSLYEKLDNHMPDVIKILDMSAPSLSYMSQFFEHDINSYKGSSEKLIKELNSKEFAKYKTIASEEIARANYFLVASQFTKESLLSHNINEDYIYKAQYGIDLSEFNIQKEMSIEKTSIDKNEITFLFVGRVIQEKGAWHFLEAIKLLNNNLFNTSQINYKFIIAGNYSNDDPNILNAPNNCEFVGHITKDKMAELYLKSDVLIFPSLSDGFGLSVLEALGFGLPVIVSENTGMSEEIEDYYNGFKIAPHNSLEIYIKLKWFIDNNDKLIEMSKNSIKTAKRLTWENYNNSIFNLISKLKVIHHEK